MHTLWLGYDGLEVALSTIVAVVQYQALFDQKIVQSYGCVPPGIRAIVITTTDAYVPSRWDVHHIRRRWVRCSTRSAE